MASRCDVSVLLATVAWTTGLDERPRALAQLISEAFWDL
jgi:hypothetical protein